MSELPPPPMPGSTTTTDTTPATPVVQSVPPPRPGELTLAWRIATAACWIGVVLALAAVWNASVQLGLSTWWLGPRAEPQPRLVQLLPFIAPVLVLLATINNVRRLSWFGLAGSVAIGAVGVGDLGRVGSIAATEIAIAGAAALISIASLTGTYRKALPTADDSTAEQAVVEPN